MSTGIHPQRFEIVFDPKNNNNTRLLSPLERGQNVNVKCEATMVDVSGDEEVCVVGGRGPERKPGKHDVFPEDPQRHQGKVGGHGL